MRNATSIVDYNTYLLLGGDYKFLGISGLSYLDSPATTSSTTYKLQLRVDNPVNGMQIVAQEGSGPSVITLLEIGA